MQIEPLRPMTLQVTMHALELASLIAAARWAVEGSPGEMTDEAKSQLKQVLANYDTAQQQLAE